MGYLSLGLRAGGFPGHLEGVVTQRCCSWRRDQECKHMQINPSLPESLPSQNCASTSDYWHCLSTYFFQCSWFLRIHLSETDNISSYLWDKVIFLKIMWKLLNSVLHSTRVPLGASTQDTTLATLILRYISLIYSIYFSITDFQRASELSSPCSLY